MPPKKRPPAPIDRPLSKAYLRGFDGWSTAYPPGLSEPNSIREMENVMVTREGAARVRPGLRSYMRTKSSWPLVGSHELFYNEHGKAYLVAVRETVDVGTADEREIVGFRVIGDIDGSGVVVMDTLANFGFELPADPNTIAFTSQTTYVKYLQIDNKIFALSNAPEGLVMLWVGDGKKAKKLRSIERPNWDVADKLTLMHPDGTWVLNNVPTSTRTNLCKNPEFGIGINRWSAGKPLTKVSWSNVTPSTRALLMTSEESAVNFLRHPLHDVATTGISPWGAVRSTVSASGDTMRIDLDPGGTSGYAESALMEVTPGSQLRVSYDLAATNTMKDRRVRIHGYDSSGSQVYWTDPMDSTDVSVGRKTSSYFTVPTNVVKVRVYIGGAPTSASSTNPWVEIKNVCLSDSRWGTAALDGDAGADYYWEYPLQPNDSRSLYHPPVDIEVESELIPVTSGDYTFSVDVEADSGKTVALDIKAYNSSLTQVHSATSSHVGTGASQRVSVSITVPSGGVWLRVEVDQDATARWSTVRVRNVLVERSASAGTYFSGATPDAGTELRRWSGTAHDSTSIEESWAPAAPTAETPGADTLVSNDKTKNRYTFSFFYTISTELGESAASQVTAIKAQRPWTTWEWEDPNGSDTDDPEQCADQLAALMPQDVFDAAVDAGATKWTAYYWYQGPNDAPSVTATRFAEVDLTNNPVYERDGFVRLTPQLTKIGVGDPLIPSESTRFNATDPEKGSQGLVAADRLILVGNPADPARISWSSGAPGDYFNFSSLLGGGSKQLTSGNLYLTGCVKLWQNPQSVDTLTILNAGDDGRSNAYYMQPAQITSLSESISVMGFEEVSGMYGTVSPYGCEVVSNALYRPLFHGLFKSTANNYNISTKPISDTIQNLWRVLQEPHHIVSSQLDSRIYFLVHNPFGDALEEGCWGNEVWVVDLMAKTPTWSRWKVQGVSLRAMDIDSVVMMSVVRPDGIFTFNEDLYSDESFDPDTGDLVVKNIRWYLETNTQGANRAHDAWASVQQSNIMVGNFIGQLRYGIRGHDVNGMQILLEKELVSSAPPPTDMSAQLVPPTLDPTEREDYLLIQRTMKEWVFFAGSVDDEVSSEGDLEARFSGGQINAVQYRYTPATVNVGYEYGSVETFEYGQSALAGATTDSGTPQPYVDLSRA